MISLTQGSKAYLNTFFGNNLHQLVKFFKRERRKLQRRLKYVLTGGFFKKPFFYFGFFSAILLVFLFTASSGLATLSAPTTGDIILHSFLNSADQESPFVSQSKGITMETPDLKITGDAVSAVSTPQVLSPQTLGDVFGSTPEARREVVDYAVQPGDTVSSLALQFNISKNTIAWANNISTNTALKNGQTLTILPVSGVIHEVRTGDTISQIASTYKAKADDIVTFNGLTNENDIFIGDTLIIPDGVMPSKPLPSTYQSPLPDSFFIYPLLCFKVTQGLHYYNAVDIASCSGKGSPVYAMAAGVVLRAGYDRIGGNRVTVQHSNGVVTYYGHLSSMQVKPGDSVYQGQQIGTEGQTGEATGPHVHIQIMGAKNFIAQRFGVGALVQASQ